MPILPSPLIEMLEAPVPMLVGITKKVYKHAVTLDESERKSKVWVFLNGEKNNVVWDDQKAIPNFYFNNL